MSEEIKETPTGELEQGEFKIKKKPKKLTDQKILQIGEQIKDKVTFSLLTLHNDKFNDLFEKGFNMNKMKAYLHNKAIASLVNKLDHKPKVILDQFAEEKLYFNYLKDEGEIYRDITFTTKFNAPGGLGVDRFQMNKNAQEYLVKTYPNIAKAKFRPDGTPEITLNRNPDI